MWGEIKSEGQVDDSGIKYNVLITKRENRKLEEKEHSEFLLRSLILSYIH